MPLPRQQAVDDEEAVGILPVVDRGDNHVSRGGKRRVADHPSSQRGQKDPHFAGAPWTEYGPRLLHCESFKLLRHGTIQRAFLGYVDHRGRTTLSLRAPNAQWSA